MELKTIWILSYGDDGQLVEVDDKIKVFLKNGEVLIGKYQHSDWVSLVIARNESDEVDIDFEDVKDIEKLYEI